jgi:serine/threonine protein kinase
MEFIEGETLAAAHARGIVHRDLKPGNIIVTRTGIKLLDFGLAKAAPHAVRDLTQTIGLTQEGSIAGTLQYIAPEVLEGAEADARSDIFALGDVLYEMASGQPPFNGKSQAGTIAAILEHEPAPLREAVAGVPVPFTYLVDACLKKDPR